MLNLWKLSVELQQGVFRNFCNIANITLQVFIFKFIVKSSKTSYDLFKSYFVNWILPHTFRPDASRVMPLNSRETENRFLLSMAALQYLRHLLPLPVCQWVTHWLLIPSLPFSCTSISQPSACEVDKHPGCTNPSNLLSWTPTGSRHSHRPLFILLKRIDFIILRAYWPIHPLAPVWDIQSLSFFMDFPQLWKIF